MKTYMEGYLSLFNQQVNRLGHMYDQARAGEYSSDRIVKDIAFFWSLWIEGMLFPWANVAQSAQEAPLLGFVVDTSAMTTDPKRVVLSYEPQTITSQLWDEAGQTSSPGPNAHNYSAHVNVAKGPFFVDIGLTDLIDTFTTPGLPVGRYVGVVYDDRPGDKAVIAQLHVLKVAAENGTPTNGGGRTRKASRRKPAARSRKKTTKKTSRNSR